MTALPSAVPVTIPLDKLTKLEPENIVYVTVAPDAAL
jgi:hypothetical protein